MRHPVKGTSIAHKPFTSGGLTANQLYSRINKRYFEGRLPTLPVYWNCKAWYLMGYTRLEMETFPYKPLSIHLNPSYRNKSKLWESTLIHEMVHVAQVLDGVQFRHLHGPNFEARMRDLAARGAFDKLW